MKNFNKLFILIQIILVVWGVIYLMLGLSGIYTNYEILSTGQKISGTVLSSKHSANTTRSPFAFTKGREILVSYKNEKGQALQMTGYTNTLFHPNVGSSVNIIYLKNVPERSIINDPIAIWGTIFFYIIIGLALVLGVFYYRRKTRLQPNSQTEFEQKQLNDLMLRNRLGNVGNPKAFRNMILSFVIIVVIIVILAIVFSKLGYS